MKNIINELWESVEKNKNYSSKWMRLFNWMNEDNLNGFIVDKDVFWYELNFGSSMPNYIYIMLKVWGKNKGLKYLYDIS